MLIILIFGPNYVNSVYMTYNEYVFDTYFIIDQNLEEIEYFTSFSHRILYAMKAE